MARLAGWLLVLWARKGGATRRSSSVENASEASLLAPTASMSVSLQLNVVVTAPALNESTLLVQRQFAFTLSRTPKSLVLQPTTLQS